MLSLIAVHPIISSDVPYLNVLTPDGWDDVGAAFQRYIDMPFCDPYKAIIGDKIIGVGCLIYYGDTVWLAAIIVHREYRNNGIGKLITQSLIDKVDISRYKTIMLDATDFGYPVYAKLGFKLVGEYSHFKGETVNPADDAHIIPFEQQYTEQVLFLDRAATCEDRSQLLLPHLDSAVIYVADGKVQGVYFPSLYRGAIIAANADAGISLMKYRIKTKLYCMLPAENKPGIDFLKANGFEYIRTSRRMCLGNDLLWQSGFIYNTINGAMG